VILKNYSRNSVMD